MKDYKNFCSVALVQAAPVMFDKAACTEKALSLIEHAAEKKPDLIVFPELFIPGYPYGMNFGFSVGSRQEDGREDWWTYCRNSILVPGPETEALGKAAAQCKAYISIGVSERDSLTGTLYNTNLIFSPQGELVNRHRKLKPTGSERLVWGDAQQDYFPVTHTPFGILGSLICWESYMPLARVALYEKGVNIYISPNTNDNEEWQSTIRHIAIEGKCFFINSDMYFTKDMYPANLSRPQDIDWLPEKVCRGGSCIVDPYGHYETEPLWDAEGIIHARLDMTKAAKSRMEFDPCGHYSRPDVLRFEFADI